MSKRHTRKTVTLRLVCVVRIFVFQQTENAKTGCIAESVAGGHTMHVPGMSVAGLCARFASQSVWRGPPLASTFYKIIKRVSF